MSHTQTMHSRFTNEPHHRPSSHGNGKGRLHLPHWAEDRVEQQPLTSVCTAFATGLVLGAGAIAVACSLTAQAHSKSLTERLTAPLAKVPLPSQVSRAFR